MQVVRLTLSRVVSADLIREARLRAGFTQAELAERSGRERSVIARWEQGGSAPSLETLLDLLAVCGYDLPLELAERDDNALARVRESALLSPETRVERMLRARTQQVAKGDEPAPFDPYAILTALERHRVAYLVIGALARVIRGTDETAHELEITPSRQPPNLTRLQHALSELAGEEARANPGSSDATVTTGHGALNIVSEPLVHAAATRTSATPPHANPSAAACARRSPPPPTSPECSAHSTATRTDQPSSPSAASSDSEPERIDIAPGAPEGPRESDSVPGGASAPHGAGQAAHAPATHLDSQRDTDAPWCRSVPIRVRCTHVAPPSPAQEHPRATPREGVAGSGSSASDPFTPASWVDPSAARGLDARRRPRGVPCRAARVHAHPGSPGARHRPLDLHEQRAALRRDGRDSVGHEADPGRRARARARRVATPGAAATQAGANRPTAGGGARRRPIGSAERVPPV